MQYVSEIGLNITIIKKTKIKINSLRNFVAPLSLEIFMKFFGLGLMFYLQLTWII